MLSAEGRFLIALVVVFIVINIILICAMYELLPIGIKLGSRLENRLHIIYPPDFLVQRKEYVDESGWAAISQLLQFIDRFYLLLLYPYKAKFWEITLSLLCREKDSKNKHVSVPLYFGADRRYLHQQRASSLETGAE